MAGKCGTSTRMVFFYCVIIIIILWTSSRGWKNMRRKVFVTLFLAVILCFTGFGIFWSQQRMGELSVFNWEKDVVTVENPDVFFDEFSKSNICAVYQWIPSKISGRDMSSYLESACTHGIDVYLLTGDPSWALEEDGETMSSEILRVQEINEMGAGAL